MQTTSWSDGNVKTLGCMYPSDPSKSYSHLVIQRMNMDCIFRDNSTDLVGGFCIVELHVRAGLAGRLFVAQSELACKKNLRVQQLLICTHHMVNLDVDLNQGISRHWHVSEGLKLTPFYQQCIKDEPGYKHIPRQILRLTLILIESKHSQPYYGIIGYYAVMTLPKFYSLKRLPQVLMVVFRLCDHRKLDCRKVFFFFFKLLLTGCSQLIWNMLAGQLVKIVSGC